ncbi:MAG: M20/M25/M40 family metallo-hydrolase [Ruminococcaceae bacterium]|nr:M20/M25/M40 family metallo-hydrolase [Oscillospiraceae bacterium]
MTDLFWIIPVVAISVPAIIVIIRTLAFHPVRRQPIAPAAPAFDQSKAAHDLQQMLRCATVSSDDPHREDKAEFERFSCLLQELFPLVHKTCPCVHTGYHGFLYHWPGIRSDQPTVLMAHYDVVPADAEQWEHPPFSGEIVNEELWGRGALDTKLTVNALFQAAETMIARGFQPQQDIWLALAGNEEVSGEDAPSAVAWFKDQGIRPVLVLDEGGAVVEGIFPGVRQPCAVIGTAEKGMMHFEMTALSLGGHASAPPPRSSLGRLSQACLRVENTPFKRHLTPPVAGMFRTLGRHSSLVYRMIFANLWLFAGLLDLICKKRGGELNALLRTTVAWTQAEGSSQTNVMPPRASMSANLRLNSKDTCTGVLAELKKIVHDPLLQLRSVSCHEPSPVSPAEGAGWQKITQAVEAVWPEALISPYLMIACSDARHYCRICDHVYRFSAMAISNELRQTIHGNDERVPLTVINQAVAFYLELITRS